MKKIQSKMKGDRVVTTDLSHAQGQLKSVMESCRNSIKALRVLVGTAALKRSKREVVS